MRLPIWGFKYIGLPFIAFGITKSYFSDDLDERLKAIMSKYQYSFEDFKRINYAIEKEIENKEMRVQERRRR